MKKDRLPFILVSALLIAAAFLPTSLGQEPTETPPPAPPATADPVPDASTDGPLGNEVRQEAPRRFAEEVDVRLVELYVTVTDRDGEPVRGLKAQDFLVRENGVVQSLQGASSSADLPVLLGLAVDTSASMFVKLGPVSRAARNLVSSLIPGRDRAFVVGFGPEPRMAQPTTGDLLEVSDALRNLEPEGRTPLWASISFSLDELSYYRGKRALVVFFDGADEDENRDYRDALEKARQVRVPIYLIIMNNEAARTEGRDFSTRAFISRLERMAAVGGGEVYYVPTHADLTSIYQRIEQELRSAYLLTYYPEIPLSEGGDREVEVEVQGKRHRVRTLSGYQAFEGAFSEP